MFDVHCWLSSMSVTRMFRIIRNILVTDIHGLLITSLRGRVMDVAVESMRFLDEPNRKDESFYEYETNRVEWRSGPADSRRIGARTPSREVGSIHLILQNHLNGIFSEHSETNHDPEHTDKELGGEMVCLRLGAVADHRPRAAGTHPRSRTRSSPSGEPLSRQICRRSLSCARLPVFRPARRIDACWLLRRCQRHRG